MICSYYIYSALGFNRVSMHGTEEEKAHPRMAVPTRLLLFVAKIKPTVPVACILPCVCLLTIKDQSAVWITVVYNHWWTGLVDWTGGLDWCADIFGVKNYFCALF